MSVLHIIIDCLVTADLDFTRLDYVSDISSIMGADENLPPIDRDSGRWKLEKYETQRRRELFYELLTYDSWQVCSSQIFLSCDELFSFGVSFAEFDFWTPSLIIKVTHRLRFTS